MINATVLERMSDFWQKIFLTVGIVIAVFGMRLLLPLLIVWAAAGLPPVEAFHLAMNPPPDDAAVLPGRFAQLRDPADRRAPADRRVRRHVPADAVPDWLFEEREHTWLTWLERPLAKAGRLDAMAVLVVLHRAAGRLARPWPRIRRRCCSPACSAWSPTSRSTGSARCSRTPSADDEPIDFEHPDAVPRHRPKSGVTKLARATGKAGFFLFLYLEVLDASFSFDGVIGAFAITSDPIIIALGLGLIGAMFVRSLTVYLVRKGTLAEYVYLEHGAHWAIGALAVILMISIGVHISEFITGLLGVAFIGASFLTSIRRNRTLAAKGEEVGTVHA